MMEMAILAISLGSKAGKIEVENRRMGCAVRNTEKRGEIV